MKVGTSPLENNFIFSCKTEHFCFQIRHILFSDVCAPGHMHKNVYVSPDYCRKKQKKNWTQFTYPQTGENVNDIEVYPPTGLLHMSKNESLAQVDMGIF